MTLLVNKLPLVRLAVFSTVTFLSFIIFIMSAHIINWTNRWYSGYFDFAALALAVSLLSLMIFPLVLYIGRVRSGALSSFIGVELVGIGFLWVLWLASAGTTANINVTGGRCNGGRNGWSTVCGETNAIEAFAFLNWLILLAYFAALLFSSIMALQAGNQRVWTSSVKDLADGSRTHEKYPIDPAAFGQYPGVAPQAGVAQF
ncbi:hypothetical protein P691DRAFT_775389 [Macrolepiota fuliginosa MF-IS2]|uniref:MARVEL domain-containing protein n=1 Tax=Macrolepiota fuliginosa MF-IS2 TaxID=1400762 RepID=A0A9P6C248_9AGAR|nr:hypothetical protein P691DRAFT_775389 [Macrolepiota fuliginosa MF-IS2]